MGGVKATLTQDDRQLKKLFKRMKAKSKDLTPAMMIIAEMLRTSVVENFEAQGRPEGWEPLANSTLKKKTNTGRILFEEGNLMDSVSGKGSSDKAEVGTSSIYAAIHHFGGLAGKGGSAEIPERPFMLIQDEDIEEAKDVLLDHIMDAA